MGVKFQDYYEILGVPRTAKPEEIIGKLDADIFTPDEAARLGAIKRRVLDGNVEHREQMWLNRPGGRLFRSSGTADQASETLPARPDRTGPRGDGGHRARQALRACDAARRRLDRRAQRGGDVESRAAADQRRGGRGRRQPISPGRPRRYPKPR